MPTSNYIAIVVTIVSWGWIWLFVVLGGSTFGREEIYFPLARRLYRREYYQGGVVLLVLVIPILLAGTVSSLLHVVSDDKIPNRGSRRDNKSQPNLFQRLCRRCKSSTATSLSKWATSAAIFACLVLPCCAYVFMCVARKLPRVPSDERRMQFLFMIIGNSFAFMALLAMSVILIPVSRQNSLLLLNLWFDSPIQAIQYIHITLGYLVLVGVFSHSILHLGRWKMMGEWWIEIIIPPKFCWSFNAADIQEETLCRNPDTECSCYHHFRNMSGVLGFVTLVVLAALSLWPRVRRQAYSIFYTTHVIAAPLAILMTVLHYPRAILYVTPSLLYYVATSFPNMMEMQSKKQQRCGSGHHGVRVLSVQEIASNQTRSPISSIQRGSIIVLHVEASNEALRRFQPGQYVKLSCPEISSLAKHPFTINTVPERSSKVDNRNVLAVHFHVSGNFTSQLARRLLSPAVPSIYMNGFMGPMNRLDQVFQHDVAVIVAGGIGITPYLSLLHELVKVTSQVSDDHVADDSHIEKELHHVVVLHWMCREDSFIDYVRQKYFQPLLEHGEQRNGAGDSHETTSLDLRIVIHKTSSAFHHATTSSAIPRYVDSASVGVSSALADKIVKDLHAPGVPFTPSVFAVGAKSTIRENIVPFLAFALIAWLGLGIVWYQYTRVIQPTAEEQIFNRVWSLVDVIFLGGIIAWLINALIPIDVDESKAGQTKRKRRRHEGILWERTKSHASDNEDDEEDDEDEDEVAASNNVELRPLSATLPNSGASKDFSDVENRLYKSKCNVSLEEVEGRPPGHELMSALDGAQRPGLFVCGPTSLMDDIRVASQERCLTRTRSYIRGTPHIALYQESFEM